MDKRELYNQHKAPLAEANGHICVCKAVSKERVEKAIAEGADSFDAVAAATTAGTGCSFCESVITDLL